MKNKIKLLLVLFLLIPIIVLADGQMKQYFDATSDANNYINKYLDRNKYLLLNNVKFKYENRSLSIDPVFTKGGLLNKSEFDLSLKNGKSYLMTGREYWTMTSAGSGTMYYIDTYALSKSTNASSGVRVTEQVKGSTKITGKGTYANPWVFEEGYEVTIKPNNSVYATITPMIQSVKAGGTARIDVRVKQGYKYAFKDDCGLTRKDATTYEIQNVTKDISCIAIFEQKIYKMNLTSTKTYVTAPSPSTIYYKEGIGWFNSDASNGVKVTKITPPTITGYTFNGYKYGSTQVINASGNILMNTIPSFSYGSDEQNLVADLTAYTYTVSYNANTGTGTSMANSTHTYDVAKYLTKNTYTKTGYSFAGWATSASGSKLYNDEQSVINLTAVSGGNVPLYAKWTANTYTVKFDKNGGSGGQSTDVTATYNAAMPAINTTAPTKSGYTFAGWYDAKTGGTKYYNADGTSAKNYDKASGTTLYARWTANTYTVKFDKNGGSGGQSADVTATYDAEMPTINTTAPTKSGYTFAGWYDAVSGGTKYYNADGTSARSYDKTGGTTLYAHWTANTYTVKFDTNGGTGGTTGNATCTYDQNCTLTANGFTKTGYTFAGWAETSTGAKKYDDKATVKNLATSGTKTLYAKWTANTYTVKFDTNGGTGGTTGNATCTYDQNCTLTANGFTKTGYTFAGWAETSTGAKKYDDKATVKNIATSGTKTLYAKWTANTYVVKFDKNGGTGGSTADVTCTYDQNCTLTTNGYSKTGYGFAGWAETSTGNVVYTNGKVVKNIATGGTKTLYAKWTANTYTVKFDTNGGTGGSTGNATCTYDQNCTLTANGFTKSGYKFIGWAETSSGAKKYDDKATVKNLATSGTKTLYAKWEAQSYTVKFYGNGNDSGSTESVTCNVNSNCTLTSNGFAKSGKTFIFWSTNSGTQILLYDNIERSGAYTGGQYVNFRNYNDAVTPVSGGIYGLQIDVKGSGQMENYLYNSNSTSKVQVAKVVTSQGNTYTRADGYNLIQTTANYQHYSAEYTMTTASATEDKFLLFRLTPSYSGKIKNATLYKKVGSESIYMDGAIVKNIASAGDTLNLYAIWGTPLESGSPTACCPEGGVYANHWCLNNPHSGYSTIECDSENGTMLNNTCYTSWYRASC